MQVDVKSLDGKSSGKVDLSDEIFGLEPRADILHRMVRYQLAKRRAGTHQTLGRSDVAKTGAKMYRQKGTGNARHHAASAPQFRGGGKAHGPQSRSHAHDLPKKFRKLALRHALSSKAKAGQIVVMSDVAAAEPKTAQLKKNLKDLGLANALVVDGAEVDRNFGLAARNVPLIDVLPVQGINVYDILRRDTLVLTKAAVDALEERFK